MITKEKGRTPVTYDDSIRGPPISVRSRFVTDLSAYIKDRCPMLHPSWYDLPVIERERLLEFLSVSFLFSLFLLIFLLFVIFFLFPLLMFLSAILVYR